MQLKNLHILNFKNYVEVKLDFPSRINVLVGPNGSGKTNLLDAIYYLSFTKSAFASSDQSLILHDEPYFMLRGDFEVRGKVHAVASSIQNGSKKMFKVDSQDYQKVTEHIGRFPVIMLAPDDVELIRESSELRRKFFDGIVSQLDARYLDELIRYNHHLKQRNSLLKLAAERGSVDWDAIAVYDAALIRHGTYILETRRLFIVEYLPIFQYYFRFLVDAREEAHLVYQTDLDRQSFEGGLQGTRSRDVILQRTTFGIHRDDFLFYMAGDREMKKLGSQGQQKSFAIAMKLAQYEILKKGKALKPILLLDDIFDKLDEKRIGKLLELMKTEFGQLFITDARPERTRQLLGDVDIRSEIFKVENGVIKHEQ